MTELLLAIGALCTGIFGTEGVRRYQKRKNGLDDTARIVRALESVADTIRGEGQQTRIVLDDHHKATTSAFILFQGRLDGMSKDCAIAHTKILERG